MLVANVSGPRPGLVASSAWTVVGAPGSAATRSTLARPEGSSFASTRTGGSACPATWEAGARSTPSCAESGPPFGKVIRPPPVRPTRDAGALGGKRGELEVLGGEGRVGHALGAELRARVGVEAPRTELRLRRGDRGALKLALGLGRHRQRPAEGERGDERGELRRVGRRDRDVGLERGAAQLTGDDERHAREVARELGPDVAIAVVRERRVRLRAEREDRVGEDVPRRDREGVDAHREPLGVDEKRPVERLRLGVDRERLRDLTVDPCMMQVNAREVERGRRARVWSGRRGHAREERVGEREEPLSGLACALDHRDVEREVVNRDALEPNLHGAVAEERPLGDPHEVRVDVEAAHPGERLPARREDAGVEAADSPQAEGVEPARLEAALEARARRRVDGPGERVESWARPEVTEDADGERQRRDEQEPEAVERSEQEPPEHQKASPMPSASASGTPPRVLGSFSSGVSPPSTWAPGMR